jgi:sortase B
MRKGILSAAAILLAAAMILSAAQLWRHLNAEREAQQQHEALSAQIETPPMTEQPSGETALPEWTVYNQYGALFEQNPDMIGWIRIDGTAIDYPVMQTPDRPNFYLKHDFEKRYSDFGVPYVAEGCSIDPQCDNITIFGHHMKSGKMFGVLENYKRRDFYEEHPVIRFDTRAGFGEYEIISAFKVSPADFPYNAFVSAADGAEFDEFVRRCKALSFYDTGVSARYGDKLICLSTCEYSARDNRLVVVARKIMEGGVNPSG